MECTTNVNSLLLHCNLGDKLGNANATPTAATSPTKPIAVPLLDGETPCDVDLSSLPFCDDDEDEIFFGQVSGKEHRKAQKFEDRQTALFVQGFRSDRRLMRYTIEMKRSQCDAGTYDEECVSSEYEHGTKHNLGETLSSICEENEQDRVSETHAGVDPGKVRQSFTECDMGVSERHCCLIRDTNSLVTAANVADETRTDHDVCSDDGHQENEDLVMGNSEACGSEKHEDACNLLHFFASVCDLEPHQDDCRRNVKDDIVMLEKKTRDTESDRSGDRVTVNDMSSTDETSISDASRTDDSTDDSRYDDQQNVSDSDDSDALTIDMGCGDETKTCGLEADVSEHEVNVCVSHVSDTDMNGGAKLNTPDAGCSHNNCGESETDVSVEADGADDYSVVENEVNKSGTDLKSGMSESDCIHEYLESDTDEEVVFGSVRNSEKRGDGYTGGTCEVDGVNIITCEISQMQLNTESSGSVGSGSETVIDVTRSNVDNLSDSGHSMNGHDACDSVRVKSSDAVCERHVPVECVSKHDQSGSKGVGDVTMPGSSQSSAECLNAQHSSGPGFNEQSNDVNTPIVALQQIHNPCCSAFQTYRKRDVAEKCEKHAVDLSDGAEITCINGSKEISVKLDFDSVVSKMEYTDASSVSPVTAVTSFACVTPNVTHGPGEFSELSHKVATTTPTFIPPTPQTTSMLICRPVCSCHGDSVREAHSTVFQDEADLPQQACSLVSNHSISCFESQGLSVSRDRQALDMNLHMMGQNNHTLATKCSCQPMASTPISGRIFAATVLQESPKVVAMVTSAGSRNPATSPSVVFTEKHFSPTLVSSSQFCEESPFGGNLRPGVSNDEDGDDIVPPTPKVQHSPHLVVFAEKHYSPMSVGRIDSDLCNHGDTVDNVVIPDATSEESPRIIFKVNNFSPVVIKNNTLPQRVPSREKTCGSTKCEHCVTVVHGDYVSSSRITGKTRSLQRVNKLKLKKGNSIKKGPALPQCSWKKTPTKFNTGSSTVTLNHSKQRPRPSPLPVLLRKPTSESKSRVRPVNGSHLSTPSRQPPVYRLGTPRHRVVSPGSTLTKATRLASPGTTLTKATRLASQSSTGHHQLPKRTQTDCNEVSEEKSQLKQLHCSRAESAGKPSAPWGAVKATYSPGAPKLLRMHESPMTPTSADNLPRVRYKEKNLNQVQLDAITQLHTLCNSQQAVRYITRPRVGGAVKRVPGKVCSRLSWQDDTLSHVPDDKHAPPSLALSPSPRSILHVKPLTELYPYSDEPLSPVVIHKAVRKTNTLAMAANKC